MIYQPTRTQTRAPKHRPIVLTKEQIAADNARSREGSKVLDIHEAIIAAKRAGDTKKVAELKARLQAARELVRMTEQEQIAAFIASRGVTRVAEGEATYDHRSMYKAVRGERSENDLIRERHVVIDHCGRERVRNGLG